jgi:hypothetical protein
VPSGHRSDMTASGVIQQRPEAWGRVLSRSGCPQTGRVLWRQSARPLCLPRRREQGSQSITQSLDFAYAASPRGLRQPVASPPAAVALARGTRTSSEPGAGSPLRAAARTRPPPSAESEVQPPSWSPVGRLVGNIATQQIDDRGCRRHEDDRACPQLDGPLRDPTPTNQPAVPAWSGSAGDPYRMPTCGDADAAPRTSGPIVASATKTFSAVPLTCHRRGDRCLVRGAYASERGRRSTCPASALRACGKFGSQDHEGAVLADREPHAVAVADESGGE